MDRQLPEILEERLRRPLPGPMVGSRFEPTPRRGPSYDQFPPGARQAAVLILLYPFHEDWRLPLILRPASMVDHAGQVSLPGGAVDPGESGAQAAIREFHEELGGEGHAIRLLGGLSPIYVNASNFRIEPWIGVTDSRPAMVPNPVEVQELLEIPLTHLRDRANFGSRLRTFQDHSYNAPHFAWGEHQIWGATCMILGEFVTLLEDCGLDSEK